MQDEKINEGQKEGRRQEERKNKLEGLEQRDKAGIGAYIYRIELYIY